MGIFKYLGGPLPKKTIFNQFYEEGDTLYLRKMFNGLCFLANWLYDDKSVFSSNPQRFQVHSCGNGPMFLGFTGSSFIGLFTLWWIPFGSEPYPLTLLSLVLIGNLIFLNLQPLWDRMAPPKLAYFDRQTGKVGYTFDIPGCDERDEFGNCCFDWRDMQCSLINESTSQSGSRAFFQDSPIKT